MPVAIRPSTPAMIVERFPLSVRTIMEVIRKSIAAMKVRKKSHQGQLTIVILVCRLHEYRTKKNTATISSATEREEYFGAEILKHIRITKQTIISANRRTPFRVFQKLVQVIQQLGAESRRESVMASTLVPGSA